MPVSTVDYQVARPCAGQLWLAGICYQRWYRAIPVTKIPAGIPISYPLHIFGLTGLTAYFGLLDIGLPKAGETVLISGAAGATGSTVGQIAKLLGCRVIGIAGGQAKCQWLLDELGYDAVIDYKSDSVGERLQELCKNSIDLFFDNVGGEILDHALVNMANNWPHCALWRYFEWLSGQRVAALGRKIICS